MGGHFLIGGCREAGGEDPERLSAAAEVGQWWVGACGGDGGFDVCVLSCAGEWGDVVAR